MPAEQHMTCMEVWGGNQVADSFVTMAGLDAWVYSKPYQGSESGGDVYYVSSCATGRITRLLVADVSGHGHAVAKTAVELRSLMRKNVNYIDQTRFVKSMNGQFAELSSAGTFATAVVATFFSPTCHMSLCNAGHPPPLLYRARTGQWTVLHPVSDDGSADPSNLPLGILDLSEYRQSELTLDVGDIVLCYTDSLVESKDEQGNLLGVARLLHEVKSLATDDPATLVPRLLDRIAQIRPGNLQDDDVTVMMFRPNGTARSYNLAHRLMAPVRIVQSWIRTGALALPDLRIANIGGAVFPSLGKLWGRSGRQS